MLVFDIKKKSFSLPFLHYSQISRQKKTIIHILLSISLKKVLFLSVISFIVLILVEVLVELQMSLVSDRVGNEPVTTNKGKHWPAKEKTVSEKKKEKVRFESE